jgi:hypothetical protein
MANIDIEAPGADLAALMAAIADLSPVQPLAQSYTAVAHTGDTNETTFATITIPAGTCRAGDKLVVIPHWSIGANNANTKTFRVKLGGTELWNGAGASTLQVKSSVEIEMITTGTQRAFNLNNLTGFGTSTAAAATSSIDMTASANLTITGQLGTGTDTITLLGYSVTLYRAPV